MGKFAIAPSAPPSAPTGELPDTIAGIVYEDIDNDDSPDQPIADVMVILIDDSGDEIGTTTSPDGSYDFSSVIAGIYTVVGMNPPPDLWTLRQ